LTPEEAFSAANINGAHALGWADRIGSLALARHAGILILNVCNYRELDHHLGANLVRMMFKRGRLIHRGS
jgi:imidazolonepropionase